MPRTLEFKGSSNVKSATLNDDGTCEVSFANGGKATYQNITADMFDEWEKAESAGRWFHNRVRSKPTDFPMIASAKAEPGEAPNSDAPAPTDSKLEAAHARIAQLQSAVDEANARADKAERELEQARIALKNAKAAGGAKAADFRPWRRNR